MPDREPVVIVYPAAGSVFYEDLARRLATACGEISRKAVLRSPTEVLDMHEDQLNSKTVMIVNPWACMNKIGNSEKFFSRLSAARERIMVLAEAVGIKWFERQFELPLQYDMLLDVGFVSQEDKLRDSGVPYRFLFNGPDLREERMIAGSEPFRRTMPWALLGYTREVRARIVAELMEKLGPAASCSCPASTW